MIGGKAAGLEALEKLGLPVPRWFVLPADVAGIPAWVVEKARELRAPLAVRSSATVEDSHASAFAGVFTSHMPVTHAGLADAIRACRTPGTEVAAHALRNNIDPRTIAVAVVVQEMVEADRAGVLFTMDPSGSDEAVLSVTKGSGQKLMQGETGGETLRVRRGETPADPLFRKLLAVGRKLEKKLGHPQDIEWAEKDGKIWYLQTRPVSTVEVPRGITWTRELSEERFPKPISPLGWSILETVLPVNLVTLRKRFGLTARRPNDVARTIRHYVYSNEKFFSIPGSLRPNPLAQARFWKGYVREAFDLLRNLPRSVGQWKMLGLTRLFRAFLFPHAEEIRSTWDRHLHGVLRDMDAFEAADVTRLADLRPHRAAMEEVARRYMEPDLAIYVVKMAASWMIAKLGGDLAGLTAGLADNRTLRMNAELEAIDLDDETRKLLDEERYDEIVPTGALARFLETNGHLTTNWDMREPTWGEDPAQVYRLLRVPRRRSFRDTREARQELRRRARASMNLPAWLSPFFDETLAILHDFMRIDEEHHFYCSRLFRPMRKLYLEYGRRLVKAGALPTVDDVWFLTIPEIDGALANPFSRRELVAARRASFARSLSVRPPARFLDQRPILEEATESGPVLRGVGASPGVAEGTVRVVETPEEMAQLRPGEILVTPSPNPAWTPAYAVAAALVTATGSVLSHGLVSAREYHLPAVVGVPLSRLSTGQRIRVDGDRGLVECHGNAE